MIITHTKSATSKVKCPTLHRPTVQLTDQRATGKYNAKDVKNISLKLSHMQGDGVSASFNCTALPTPEPADVSAR